MEPAGSDARPAHVNGLAVGIIALALLITALLGGSLLSGDATLSALPERNVDLGVGSIGNVTPVRQELITKALGRKSTAHAQPTTSTATTVAAPRPAASPRSTTPPGPAPQPGVAQTRNGAKLTILFASKSPTVKVGELIEYTITVANAGDVSYAGMLYLSSHVPNGTVEETPERQCLLDTLPVLGPLLSAVCVPDVTNFLNEHRVHPQRQYTQADPLSPGEVWSFTFAVRVQPQASSGSEIVNHAHLQVGNQLTAGAQSNEVKVVVEDGLVDSQPSP